MVPVCPQATRAQTTNIGAQNVARLIMATMANQLRNVCSGEVQYTNAICICTGEEAKNINWELYL